jgi:hypothetical protein
MLAAARPLAAKGAGGLAKGEHPDAVPAARQSVEATTSADFEIRLDRTTQPSLYDAALAAWIGGAASPSSGAPTRSLRPWRAVDVARYLERV